VLVFRLLGSLRRRCLNQHGRPHASPSALLCALRDLCGEKGRYHTVAICRRLCLGAEKP